MRYKSFDLKPDGTIQVIDQRYLPHKYQIRDLTTSVEVVEAIQDMTIRGAGTIGSVAALGVAMALAEAQGSEALFLEKTARIRSSRPTAVNLMWAVDRMVQFYRTNSPDLHSFYGEALKISDEDVQRTAVMGRLGCDLIEQIAKYKKGRVNILTHCNAGWLGITDSGSALAPIYEAKRRGLDIHVWVDETRPRNQGGLTAWELKEAGIHHTVVVDNAGGLLMMKGEVDIVFVGADRVTANGDTANKIGTYLKALAAKAHNVPFYVILPLSTFDLEMKDGASIPIEDRAENEVLTVTGRSSDGKMGELFIYPEGSHAYNPAFDITPASLITGLITDRGICKPERDAILKLI